MCQHNLCCKYSVLLTNTDEVQKAFELVCESGSFVDFTLTVEVMHSNCQFSVNVLINFLCFYVCIYVMCLHACVCLFGVVLCICSLSVCVHVASYRR